MKNSRIRLKKIFTYFIRILPLVCMIAAFIWFSTDGKNFSLQDMLNYSPENPIAAAVFLLLAFGLKSLSLMFPVLLLFALGGRLFPMPIAIAINTAGIAITLSLPYFVGLFSGKDLTEKLMDKYPKLKDFRAIRNRNTLFFSFMLRAMGILPCDVVSLYSGNTRMPYHQYLTGGILGFMPDLLCASIVGQKISEPSSPWFWVSIIINVVICVASIIIYSAYIKKDSANTKEKNNG